MGHWPNGNRINPVNAVSSQRGYRLQLDQVTWPNWKSSEDSIQPLQMHVRMWQLARLERRTQNSASELKAPVEKQDVIR